MSLAGADGGTRWPSAARRAKKLTDGSLSRDYVRGLLHRRIDRAGLE